MMIPHVEYLGWTNLKDPKTTLSMLLEEASAQDRANGDISYRLKQGNGPKRNKQLFEWMESRKAETSKISEAVKAEILRRFDELEKRAEAAERALEIANQGLDEHRPIRHEIRGPVDGQAGEAD